MWKPWATFIFSAVASLITASGMISHFTIWANDNSNIGSLALAALFLVATFFWIGKAGSVWKEL